MQLPSILGSVINLLLGLASVAGLGSLILAGWSLRQEGAGVNFQVGGSFLRYVLWAGIFLTLPGVFSWLNANGVSVQQETTGAPSGYMQQIETVIETFVTDIVLNHLVPVLAAAFVLKGVLDASEGHAPVGSIIASLFLLGVYGVYNHATQQWNDVSAYATTNFEATVRHRVLAEVLKKVGAPLERADLVLVLQALLDQSNPVRRETLARRSKLPPTQLTTTTKVHDELVTNFSTR